ncbi:hypothetical protein BT69DRAFT_1342390 [Atractiella rhizophila]|nr:hypothetical protein BT69DRAFT_1342390 [Atractiella rhizophila]
MLKRGFYNTKHDPSKPIESYVQEVSASASNLKSIGLQISDTDITDVLIFNLVEDWGNLAGTLMVTKEELSIQDVIGAPRDEEGRRGGSGESRGGTGEALLMNVRRDSGHLARDCSEKALAKKDRSEVDSTNFLLTTVLNISSPSSPSSAGVEAIKASEIYLLSTTLQMSTEHDAGLASKFEDYGDAVRTLQVGMMEISAGALQAVKDVRRGANGFQLERKDWKYTTNKLTSHTLRLEGRLDGLVKNSGLAAKIRFRGGWKGKRIVQAIESARLAYDGVRRTRIGLMLAKEVGMKAREALNVFLEFPDSFEGQEADGMRDWEKERIQDLITKLSQIERIVTGMSTP